MNRLLLVIVSGLLAINIAACGDDSGGGTATPDPAPNNDPNNVPNNMPNNDPNPDPNPAPNNDPNPDPNPAPTPDADPCEQVGNCEDGTPDEYDYAAPGSFFSEVVLETDANVGADIDGDGNPDNALGALLSDLGNLLGDADLNQQLAESIADGSLALGATWPDFIGGLADSADADIHMFSLEDADGDPSTQNEYFAARASFIDGTKTPRIQFQGAAVSGGALDAGPADFALTIPLGDIALAITVTDARIEGDISEDATGISLANGTLAGAVSLDSVVDALNAFLQSDGCSCLGLQGPLIDLSLGAGPQACVGQYDDSTCADADQDICATIAGACILAVPVISGQTDIDLDGDGEPDGISVFIRLTLTGTNISGAGE